jgi:hypothetical protein
MFDKMLPYKLGQTMVSNCWGFETICIELSSRDRRVGGQRQSGGSVDRLETDETHVLSTIIESKAIPLAAYSLATSVQVLRKRPSPSYMARQCGKPESARVLDPTTSPLPRTDLHNVGLVDTGDLFPAVLERIVEREPGDPLGLDSGHDLQVLHHSRVTLVLQPGVLSLGVFSDDGKVDSIVSGGDTVQGLADDDVGVNVEGLTHGDVPRVVSIDRGVEDSLEPDLVTLERLHSPLELGLVAVGLARDVVLFPLDGDVERGKDLLDRVGDFGSDTVSGDEGDGIGTTVLGRDLQIGTKKGRRRGEFRKATRDRGFLFQLMCLTLSLPAPVTGLPAKLEAALTAKGACTSQTETSTYRYLQVSFAHASL